MQDFSVLYDAIITGKTEVFQKEIQKQLHRTISYMDSAESFYHGFMVGILTHMSVEPGYRIRSNRESGAGRYDICIYTPDREYPPIIFELKKSPKYKEMSIACDGAIEQIKTRKYFEEFEEDGYTQIMCYGMGFYGKEVRIKLERFELDN